MKKIKVALWASYVAGIFVLAFMALYRWITGGPVLAVAEWAPAVGIIAVVSGQMDLLTAIEEGKSINMRARMLDFLHWLLLVGVNIGAWFAGATNLAWFILKILLIGIIGWQIGIGYSRKKTIPSSQEQLVGLGAGTAAVCLGLASGLLRALDETAYGWGWRMETVTAILSTLIVLYWIGSDMQSMRRNPHDYPRPFFLKGIVSNILVFWFWIHLVAGSGSDFLEAWLTHLGLTVNILVGNAVYLYYYASYEYYRKFVAKSLL